MRPHKLMMKAFGPFAKETTVDFDRMGNSIYLISGDTGSGKTTIFDGIIYALYGTASGGARSGLGTESFHSDYAKDGQHREEMRVEFTFSNAGRTFTVMRKMNWGKKGDSKSVSKGSALSEGGNTLVWGKGREDKDEVTAKVTEILGLDADQFRRIIMLAQGEFQKFLTARSDERGAILGKLYDNRQHQDFQLRLKAAAARLREKDETLISEAKAQLKLFVYPEHLTEEERSALLVDHPFLLSKMQEVNQRMEAALLDLQREIAKKEAHQKKLETEKTQGEARNALLDDLAQKREQLSRLEDEKSRFEALKARVKLAEAAERVLPSELAGKQAEENWRKLCAAVAALAEKQELLKVRAAALQEAILAAEKENEPKIAEDQKEQSAVRTILPVYEELAKSRAERQKKIQEQAEIVQKVKDAKEELENRQKRQTELKAELERLSEAGEAAVANAKRVQEDFTARREDLTAVRQSVQSVKRLAEEETAFSRSLLEKQRTEVALEEKHLSLNKAFLQGQAGFLAQEMREKLKTETEVTCPVCGVKHTRADESRFAECHEDIPSREDVDKAYQKWNEAREAANTAKETHDKKEAELNSQRQVLLEQAEKLIAVSDWEVLADGSVLSAALADCEKKLLAAENAYQKAVEDRKTKEKALSEKAGTDEAIAAAEAALEQFRQRQSEADNAATAAETSVKNWEKQLQGYPENREQAERRIDFLEERIRTRKHRIEEAQKAFSDCQNQQAATTGEWKNACAEEKNRKAEKEEKEAAYAAQRKKYAFADDAAYRDALQPEGVLLDAEGIGRWITHNQEKIGKYEQECRELQAAIDQLLASAKGMERTDIRAVEEQIGEIAEQLNGLQNKKTVLAADVRTNQSVFEELSSLQKQRSRYRKVFQELNPLADTANGNYAFCRYVLRGFFDRIVEHANVHLETMTDGEYALVPKETGDGRKNIGLELKVLNTITGLERETASLSGGQLFEASLALALGLSDIVQMESTSRIQIDSMFIDEGFGSLDGARLDKAIEVLQHLSAGKRQIGIISHVARLDECLPRKIHVIARAGGSTVEIETDA